MSTSAGEALKMVKKALNYRSKVQRLFACLHADADERREAAERSRGRAGGEAPDHGRARGNTFELPWLHAVHSHLTRAGFEW